MRPETDRDAISQVPHVLRFDAEDRQTNSLPVTPLLVARHAADGDDATKIDDSFVTPLT